MGHVEDLGAQPSVGSRIPENQSALRSEPIGTTNPYSCLTALWEPSRSSSPVQQCSFFRLLGRSHVRVTARSTMSNTLALSVYIHPKYAFVLTHMHTAFGVIGIRSQTSPSGRSPTFSRTVNMCPICVFLSLSTKEAQPEEDPSVAARLQRLQNNYEDYGMRRTVEGVLVVHDHGHPHILMLQIANAFFKLYVECTRRAHSKFVSLTQRRATFPPANRTGKHMLGV